MDSRSTALLAREKGSIVDSSAREGRLVRVGSSHGVERAQDVPERDAIVVRERLGIVRAGGWDAVGDADDAGRRSGAKCVGGGADVYANVRAFGVGDDGADDAGAGIAERGARGVVFGVERASAFMYALAFFLGLPTLVLAPAKFGLCFSFGSVASVCAVGALRGAGAQLKHMTSGRLPRRRR